MDQSKIQGAFGNRTLSDLSEFFSDDSALIPEKNSLSSLRARLPNATQVLIFML
jgi:hypothetical protein